MNRVYRGLGLTWLLVLSACTAIQSPIVNQYQLTAVGYVSPRTVKEPPSILVMQPNAMVGFETDKMLYVNKPYALKAFANNSWMSPPAAMLLPLMVHSLEASHYFYAVAVDPNVSKTDYRLETQLFGLQQNFLTTPSQLELVVEAMVIHTADSRVIASEVISERVPCPTNDPYGGVIAANKAVRELTRKMTNFVIDQIERDR